MEPLKKKLTSRKFLLTIFTSALVILNQVFGLGLSTESLAEVAAVVGIWLLGETALDRERLKAERMVEVQIAQHNFESVVKEAQEVIKSKDVMIDGLRSLLDIEEEADHEAPEGV